MRAQKRRSSSQQDPLPPELWREILARLPSKTLIKFRCVCKTWLSFIDSPDFISMHLKIYPNNSQKTQLLVLQRLSLTCGSIALVYKILHRETLRKITQLVINSQFHMVFDSDMVNGLMLMENDCFFIREFCLWNSSLKKSLKLPICPLNFMSNQGGCYLGYVPSNGDYKVVSFRAVDSVNGELSMAVYSLFDRVWRVRPENVNVPNWCYQKLMARFGVVYSEGAIYWKPIGIEEETRLVCFDFENEEFRFVDLPNFDEKMLRFLFVLGDSLAVFSVSIKRSCIWVMEKEGGKMEWRKYFIGDSSSIVYEFFERFENSNVKIVFVENKGTFLVLSDGKLMSYNVTSREIKSHRIEHLGKVVECLYLDVCLDSLVLGVE